jgi:hypothetical protein
MLIDSFAPNPDAVEVHEISIHAPRDVVYQALRTADLGDSMVIKALLFLRSVPKYMALRCYPPGNQKIGLQTLIDNGFCLLAEQPPDEIVLGVTGRFWRLTGNVSPFNRRDFDQAVASGFARGIWNFSTTAVAGGKTILRTETRVTCGDPASRRKFLRYWFIVRPFSGLIRLIMLKNVRRAAETASGFGPEASRPAPPVI